MHFSTFKLIANLLIFYDTGMIVHLITQRGTACRIGVQVESLESHFSEEPHHET